MDQQTWMTWVGIAGFALALFSYLGVIRRDLKGEFAGLRTELKTDIKAVDHRLTSVRDELKTDITNLRDELKTDISNLRDELKAEIHDVRDELKADIGKLDGRMTVMEQRTYDLRGLLSPPRTQSG